MTTTKYLILNKEKLIFITYCKKLSIICLIIFALMVLLFEPFKYLQLLALFVQSDLSEKTTLSYLISTMWGLTLLTTKTFYVSILVYYNLLYAKKIKNDKYIEAWKITFFNFSSVLLPIIILAMLYWILSPK